MKHYSEELKMDSSSPSPCCPSSSVRFSDGSEDPDGTSYCSQYHYSQSSAQEGTKSSISRTNRNKDSRRTTTCRIAAGPKNKNNYYYASFLDTFPTLFTVVLLIGCFLTGITHAQYPISGVVFEGMCPVPECYCGLDPRNRLEVDCSSGGLNEIPTSRMAPHIEVIRITSPKGRFNHLTIGRFFRQFRRLEELHIVNSNIPNIGENNFIGVISLRLLNLTRNNINQLIDFNFRGLLNLETLSLSENHIDTMGSECFKNLTKLKVLDLSRNRISSLTDRLFYNLHMLEVLDLSDNRLKDGLNADVFRDIWRLKEFRCQRCGLRGIPPLWYSLLPALQRLDLRYNELKYLREGEFSALKSIQEIYLDGNRINVITEEAFKLTKVRVLSLSYNGLVSVDRTAFINASVESLDLSGNKFESLNKLIFLDLRNNLTKLDLSRNPKLSLSSLLIILSENRKLRWLSVARNNYESLPLDLFEDNRSLQHLNLSNNRLRELFKEQFTPLQSLQMLDLSYNRLLGIESDVLLVFDRMSLIREIRLEGNPWACDLCHIPALHKWIQTSPIFKKGCLLPNGPFCLRCRYPSAMYDKTVIHLEEKDLEWCDPYGGEYGDESRLGLYLGGGLLFLILLVIIGGLLLRYQFWHTAHYYTHEDARPDGLGLTPPPYSEEDLAVLAASGGGGSQMYYATINGTHTKIISTIDEKNFEATSFYPDMGANLNLNPLYRPPSSAGGQRSISPSSIPSKSEYSMR